MTLRCLCGKTLTDHDVCPMPYGVVCNGQTFPPKVLTAPMALPWETKKEKLPWET